MMVGIAKPLNRQTTQCFNSNKLHFVFLIILNYLVTIKDFKKCDFKKISSSYEFKLHIYDFHFRQSTCITHTHTHKHKHIHKRMAEDCEC